MTISQMHTAFKLLLDKSSSLEFPAFEDEEIDFWLNKAQKQFVKNRFLGTNKGVGFEQTSKRIMDLSVLLVEDTLVYKDGTELVNGTIKENSFIGDLASCTETVFLIVGEEVLIAYSSILDGTTSVTTGNLVTGEAYYVLTGVVTHAGDDYTAGEYFHASNANIAGAGTICLVSHKRQGVTNCTANTYRSHIDDPYSEHRLHYEEAKPLRLIYQRYVELITDGNYGILEYNIRYLREPVDVDLALTVDCELPDHTHDEIVTLAANMVLENIEQPRYESNLNELNKVE